MALDLPSSRNLAMKKIGITGGSGLVGRAWVEYGKNKGYTITSFQRTLPAEQIPNVEYQTLNVNNSLDVFEAIKEFDLVIHAAAMVSYHRRDTKMMHNTNVKGTSNVVNACIHNGIPKLILISSTAALDSSTKPLDIVEDRLWNLNGKKTEYAKTKYYAELEAWRGQQEGLEVATVCPGVVIGDGKDSKSSNQLYEVVRKRWNLYPTGSNGFINAKELSKIIDLIIEKDAFGHRYLAVTHNITFKELLYSIAAKINLPVPKYPIAGFRFKFMLGVSKMLEFLNFKSPLPSSGLLNTRQKLIYKPKNIYDLLDYKSGDLL